MKPPRFHSPQEAADILGISKRTLRRAVEAGELPCIKYNSRTWRFSAVDLALWHLSKGGKLSTSRTKGTTPQAG
jgi:excisionase family DNA binding protein